jgi:DNA repair protein RadC
MLLVNEVTHATDLELLAVVLGNCRTAAQLLKQAGGSLFNLLHAVPSQTGDLFCAQGSSGYGSEPMVKLQAARELAARAIAEDLGGRDCLTSPAAV